MLPFWSATSSNICICDDCMVTAWNPSRTTANLPQIGDPKAAVNFHSRSCSLLTSNEVLTSNAGSKLRAIVQTANLKDHCFIFQETSANIL